MIATLASQPRGTVAWALLTGVCAVTMPAHANAARTAREPIGTFVQTALVTHWSLPAKAEPVGTLPEPTFVRPLVDPPVARQSGRTLTAVQGSGAALAEAEPLATPPPAAARIGPHLAVRDLSTTRYTPDDPERPYRTPTDIKRLEIAFQLFNAADATSTVACLERADCQEQNPIYGKHPKPAMVIGAKAITAGVHYWVMRSLLPEHPGVARAFGWFTATIQGGVVGFNMSQMF